MRRIPGSIEPILAAKRETVDPGKATTATFYSISNCQRGLAGASFGNFLIKQVVEEISRELPALSNFVTLSPVSSFAEWLRRERLEICPLRCARKTRRYWSSSTARIGGSILRWWKRCGTR